MRRAPPLLQEVLDACIKPLPFNLPVDLEACPVGKEGIWRNLIRLCMSIPTGRDSLGVWRGGGGHWPTKTGMLPSVSEWMTSTNCASLGSNLSSGGFPLNKGPAGSRPARKTELAWQPHAMSHLQRAFDPSWWGWFTGCRAPLVVRHSHSHPAVSGSFPQPHSLFPQWRWSLSQHPLENAARLPPEVCLFLFAEPRGLWNLSSPTRD